MANGPVVMLFSRWLDCVVRFRFASFLFVCEMSWPIRQFGNSRLPGFEQGAVFLVLRIWCILVFWNVLYGRAGSSHAASASQFFSRWLLLSAAGGQNRAARICGQLK
jgi:hypothetical protein